MADARHAELLLKRVKHLLREGKAEKVPEELGAVRGDEQGGVDECSEDPGGAVLSRSDWRG